MQLARAFGAHRRWATSCSRFALVQRNYGARPSLDSGEQHIYEKLSEKFGPTDLQVQDISGGCGTFYAISITSGAFKGMSAIKQHRLVNETLKSEIAGIHGLQLKTSIPISQQ